MNLSMGQFRKWWVALALLAAAGIVGTSFLLAGSGKMTRASMVACPVCGGAGKITVMASHPDAMGSTTSPSGKLIDIDCAACEGKATVTPDHRRSP